MPCASFGGLARPAGFEPTTPWFVARYSIQLSYGREEVIIIAGGVGRSAGPGLPVSPATEPPYNASMPLTRCPYCEHGNPEDSKFCGACGGALNLPAHLAPCPRCGAVSPVKATVCYWCHGQLPGHRKAPHRYPRVIVGTAVLATIAVLGYYAYRSLVDARQLPTTSGDSPTASSDSRSRGGPVGAGFLDGNAVVGDRKSAGADDSAKLTSPAASPSGNPPADPERPAANQPRAGRQPVKSREANTGSAAITRPQAINVGGASEPRPSRSEACTAAGEALGLCAMKPVQKKEPETAATVEAAIKRPQTTGAGNAGAQEPPLPQTCTEAVAALGLCAPKPIQRRE